MDFAAEQAGEFAADRKAKTGAAIFAAGAGIGLLERLEDQLLLFQRECRCRYRTPRRRPRPATWLSTGCSALQPPSAADTLRRTPPSAVNLNAFDSRFFSTCCRRLESVTMLRPRFGSSSMSNDKLPVFRLVPERPPDRLEQIGGEDFLGIHRHRAGFDLREIEDVADQIEQVGAGAVNGAGEFDLLGRSGCRPGFR